MSRARAVVLACALGLAGASGCTSGTTPDCSDAAAMCDPFEAGGDATPASEGGDGQATEAAAGDSAAAEAAASDAGVPLDASSDAGAAKDAASGG